MPDSPQRVYDKIEGLKGKKLVLYLIPLFILFVFVGFAIGNLIQGPLRKNEEIDWERIQEIPKNESVSFRGKVVFVDPNFYPEDDIRYYLEDESGNTTILLKSYDEKLTVVEGLNVIVFGEITKTFDESEEVLLVEKVVVRK